jgi:tRNA-Thr(GGU) m(6)t(6)A37 methyltransferase TsaA
MNDERFEMRAVGYVESPVSDRRLAARQGDEGAPVTVVRLRPEVREAARDIKVGDELILLTWLHLADRSTQLVHPRMIEGRPLTGVFSTRSPDRPNPIGLHRVTVTAVGEGWFEVDGLEAVDGTPVVDIKPVIGGVEDR